MSVLSNIVFESRTLFTVGNAALAYGAVKVAPKILSAIANQIFQKGVPQALNRLAGYTAIRLLPALPFAYMTALAVIHMVLCKYYEDRGYCTRTAEEFIAYTPFGDMPCMICLDKSFDEGQKNSILSNIACESRPLFALGNAALAYGAVKVAPKILSAIANQIFQKGAPQALNRLAGYTAIRLLPALPFAYMTALALIHIAICEWDEDNESYKVPGDIDSLKCILFDNLPLMEALDEAFTQAALSTSIEDDFRFEEA